MRLSSRTFALAALLAAPLDAGSPGEEKVLTARLSLAPQQVPAGGKAELALSVELHGSWHINAARPRDPMLIPTRLTLDLPAGVTAGEVAWPEPKVRSFGFSDEPLLVYEGKFTARVPLLVALDATAAEHTVAARLRYQACDDERCLAPREEKLSASLRITPAAAAVAAPALQAEPAPVPEPPASATAAGPASPAAPAAAPPAASAVAPAAAAPAAPASAGPTGLLERLANRVAAWFSGGNYLAAFAVIFVIGLALNLTPCVYPVIPLTVSYFASQSEQRKGRTFSLAVVYVLGMAVMYSALGVVAAIGGKAFGSALASPWVIGFVAAVIVALALSMFGLWEIRVPAALSRALGASPSGHAGAAFMGLTVGIVAAPCLAPAILALVLLVGRLQSIPLGVAIFFVLALGLGLPYLVLGTMAGAMSRLPRSGEWMLWVKKVFGLVLLAVALYFLRPLTGSGVFVWGLAAIGLFGAVWLGWLDRVGAGSDGFRRVKRATGAAFAVAAGLAIATALAPSAEGGIRWTPYAHSAYENAVRSGRPVLVDFTAEWCLPCKELEHSTFSEATVAKAAERFVALRADGTRTDGNRLVDELRDRWSVLGYPTVLFIDSKGKERSDLRVVGFVGPDDFRARLEKVD